jgi:hypothetical protein
MRGVARPNLQSIRAHPGERPAPKWPIACALVNGKSSEDAGREVNRSRGAVEGAGRRMGLLTKWRHMCHDFGEPITAAYVRRLQQISGLSVLEFAEQVGMSSNVQAIYPSQAESRHIEKRHAEKVLRWRDGHMHNLLQSAPTARHEADRYSGTRILKTFFPRLQGNYELLRAVIPLIRSFLNEHPKAGPADFGEDICHQVMLEADTSKKRIFGSFLPWAAQRRGASNETFLERHWSLLGEPGRPFSLATKILSAELGTTFALVDRALRPGVSAIPPGEMRSLLRTLWANRKAELAELRSLKNGQLQPPSKRGKKGQLLGDTAEKILMVARLELDGISARRIADKVFPRNGDREGAWSAFRSLRRRHRTRIDKEKQRLTALRVA